MVRPKKPDEEEDYEVADLSAVPVPKIEFVMPNLTPLDSVNTKTGVSKKTNPTSSGSVLTASKLNNEIVRLRSVIREARVFFIQRLVRRLKRMEILLVKKPSDTLRRKIERLEEELRTVKTISLDDISKFALLNKKRLDELKISGETPTNERCLYKLSCEPRVVKAVMEYRSRYSSWELTTSFLLQRLGLQYAAANREKILHISGSDEVVKHSVKEVRKKTKAKRKSNEEYLGGTPKNSLMLMSKHRVEHSDNVGDGISESLNNENNERNCSISAVNFIQSDNEADKRTRCHGKQLLEATRSLSKLKKLKKKKRPQKASASLLCAGGAANEKISSAVVKQIRLDKGGEIGYGEKPKDGSHLISDEVSEYADAESLHTFFLPYTPSSNIQNHLITWVRRSPPKTGFSEKLNNSATRKKERKEAQGGVRLLTTKQESSQNAREGVNSGAGHFRDVLLRHQ